MVPLARVVGTLLGTAAGVAIPAPLFGQEAATVRVEENFRAEPSGAILGQLSQGTRVTVEARDGEWAQATIHGFVWMPSVQSRETAGVHGLVVAVPEGENLRDSPAGRVTGRLANGTVLQELERIPGWVEVRRTGWIWNASLDVAEPIPSASAPPTNSGSPAASEPAATAGSPAVGASSLGGTWLRAGSRGAPILSAPDGDTLGLTRGGSELRVLSQQGNWARVQLEGWVWVPALSTGEAPGDAESAILTDVRAGDLAREYDRYRGRLVEVRLQYISLERAEQVRTDFREGEPFLLTRSLDEDRTFVYVAIPPEQMDAVGSLIPLESIRVLARVRAGAAVFTGSPILDLIELERIR